MGSSVQKEKHMSTKTSKSHDPSVSLSYDVGFFMRAMYSFTQTCSDATRGVVEVQGGGGGNGVVEVTRSSFLGVGWGGGVGLGSGAVTLMWVFFSGTEDTSSGRSFKSFSDG